MNETYIIAGGDKRFIAAADLIAERGKNVKILFPAGKSKAMGYSDTEKIGTGDVLILPVPVTRDGKYLNTVYTEKKIPVEHLTRFIKENGKVFGGNITDDVKNIFMKKNAAVTDYMNCERLTLFNALLTAEGTVMYALQNQDICLFGQKILIVGAGRIGKALIKILCGFGADITVSARSDADLFFAEAYGCKQIKTEKISEIAEKFFLVINTVPAPVIGEEFIEKMRKNTLIIDLASAPGGTDFASAERHGVKAVNLLGIPGKYSYISAGELIARTVLDLS